MYQIINNKKFKILIIVFIGYSLSYADMPGTLKNQTNIPKLEFFREYKDIKKSKVEYIYDVNGKTVISKNYLKNEKLVSKTTYRNSKKQDVFIYYTNCYNEDCY